MRKFSWPLHGAQFPKTAPKFLIGLVVGCGLGVTVSLYASTASKTYSTRGTITEAANGKIVLKDQAGQTWEYTSTNPPAKLVGKQVKVTYTMNAVQVEAQQ